MKRGISDCSVRKMFLGNSTRVHFKTLPKHNKGNSSGGSRVVELLYLGGSESIFLSIFFSKMIFKAFLLLNFVIYIFGNLKNAKQNIGEQTFMHLLKNSKTSGNVFTEVSGSV